MSTDFESIVVGALDQGNLGSLGDWPVRPPPEQDEAVGLECEGLFGYLSAYASCHAKVVVAAGGRRQGGPLVECRSSKALANVGWPSATGGEFLPPGAVGESSQFARAVVVVSAGT